MRNALLFLAFLTGWAVLADNLKVSVPFAKDSPVVDGKLDDPCWQKLPWTEGFSILAKKTKPEAATRFKIFHDRKSIYLALEADEPAMDKLVESPPMRNDSPGICRHDSVEIDFVLDGRGASYYKLMVTAGGLFADMRLEDDNTGLRKFMARPEWDSRATVKTAKLPDKWTVEAAIPLGAFDYDTASSDGWRFNIDRNRHGGGMSSFSPLDGLSFCAPWQFARLELKDFNPRQHDWKFSSLSDRTSREEGTLKYSFAIDIGNNTGEFRSFGIQAELSRDGKLTAAKSVGNLSLPATFKNYTRQEVSLGLPPGTKGDHTLSIVLRGSDGALLKQFSAPVKVEYCPLSAKVIRPPYRNNIYATMKNKEIEAELSTNSFDAKEITVELLDPGKKTIASRKTKSGGLVRFNAAGLPDGTYTLRASAVSESGEKAEKNVAIRKLAFQKGEVWLDKNGVAYVDGKIFLPFGWFSSGSCAPTKGENSSLEYCWPNKENPAGIIGVLDTAEKLGKKTMFYPYLEEKQWVWDVFEDRKNRKGELTPKQREFLTESINKLKTHQGLLAWYMADEPEGRDDNPVWYRQARELIAELDPYHPTVMLNCGTDGIVRYHEGCDILLPDCYPAFYENGNEQMLLCNVSIRTRLAAGLKPTWLAPQAFCFGNDPLTGSPGRPPTFDELRNQIFQVFANDGKGIMLYVHTFMPMFTDLRAAAMFLPEEADRAKEWLLAPNQNGELEIRTEPEDKNFQAALKVLDGKVCLIAVNTSKKKIKATFKVKKPSVSKLFVLSEGRTEDVKDGSFSDVFEPTAAHVYLNDQTVAGDDRLSAVRREIEDAKKSAFKPGNLAAVGELLLKQHKEFNEGKLPSGTPKITVSSEKHWATIDKTRFGGSGVYFLLDGKIDREPLRPETNWAPDPKDEAPYYLDLKLPREAEIHEARLYTFTTAPGGTVRSGEVQVKENGKFRTIGSFTDNKEHVVTVSFPETKASEIRIKIDKTDYPPKNCWGVLSEIEIYGKYP